MKRSPAEISPNSRSAIWLSNGIAERLHFGHRREALLAARGILADGKKTLLHVATGSKEDTGSCPEFFRHLRVAGCRIPVLVVSDGAPGMIE